MSSVSSDRLGVRFLCSTAFCLISEIWCSQSYGCEEFYLLGYNAVQSFVSQPTFRMNISHVSLKRRFTLNGLHSFIFHNIELFCLICLISTQFNWLLFATTSYLQSNINKSLLDLGETVNIIIRPLIDRLYLLYSEKTALAPLCPPQIPHELNFARTRTTAVGTRWLTAWAMARPET
jgi:hypothetical protein